MKIRNYTSTVPAAKTIARIEEILAEMGAKAIGKNYQNGRVNSITFQLFVHGEDHLVRLPANPEAVYGVLMSDGIKNPTTAKLQQIREQAERTAWKIQQEWLEIELSLIKLNQKDPLQAFLSYLWDGERTFFERLRCNGFKALPESTPHHD